MSVEREAYQIGHANAPHCIFNVTDRTRTCPTFI